MVTKNTYVFEQIFMWYKYVDLHAPNSDKYHRNPPHWILQLWHYHQNPPHLIRHCYQSIIDILQFFHTYLYIILGNCFLQ
jgi:hypothetical protein